MRDVLIKATESAIRAVDSTRFFHTERGFQGRFYCALQSELDRAGLLTDGAILEMEYQKSARHGLGQRPDIIFHVPVEYSHDSVDANNFAVWALKRRATDTQAREDFYKLNQMLDELKYPWGFFVNIDASDSKKKVYEGNYKSNLFAVAAQIINGKVEVSWD